MHMNKKKLTALILGCTLSAALLFSGCGSIIDEIDLGAHSENTIEEELANQSETPVSGEDATIHLASHWYNDVGEKLPGATVSIMADGAEVYTGVTDENGFLPACSFPSNTKITFTVKDASGATLGSSEAAYFVSEEYTVISMFTSQGSAQKIQIPSGKTNIEAAMFIDSNKHIGHSNITINRNAAADQAETVPAEETAPAEAAPAEETAPAEEAPAEEAATEDTAEEEPAEEDTAEEADAAE